MRITLATGLAVLAVASATTRAAFVEVDDFESYAAGGSVTGSNGWVNVDEGDKYRVITDPHDPTNLALGGATALPNESISAFATIANTSLGIGDGATGTLFLRMLGQNVGATNDHWMGLGSTTGDETVAGALRAGFTTGDGAAPQVNPFNGTGVALTDNVWYSIWIVADNAADTHTVYVQGGPEYATQTSLGTSGFRSNATSAALTAFNIQQWEGRSGIAIDDLYVAAGTDLSDPTAVPEPASLGLAAIAGLGGLRRRRRA